MVKNKNKKIDTTDDEKEGLQEPLIKKEEKSDLETKNLDTPNHRDSDTPRTSPYLAIESNNEAPRKENETNNEAPRREYDTQHLNNKDI